MQGGIKNKHEHQDKKKKNRIYDTFGGKKIHNFIRKGSGKHLNTIFEYPFY